MKDVFFACRFFGLDVDRICLRCFTRDGAYLTKRKKCQGRSHCTWSWLLEV